MDQLLLPYLQATDELESQRNLDDLLLLHAAPAVRRIIRTRLGFHVNQRGTNPYNQDAEDLYQEILTRIIQTLQELKTTPSTAGIGHFRLYVARTAENMSIDYLRSKSPE